MKNAFILLGLLLCLTGCDRVDSARALSKSEPRAKTVQTEPAPQPAAPSEPIQNEPATPEQLAQPAPAPAPSTFVLACYTCAGTGLVKCSAENCDHGKLGCPGPCLKLSKGTWEPLEVEGHGPDELWQKFHDSDGTFHAWNQAHVGEVIEMQEGKAINTGACKVCGGTAKINCTVCKGTGRVLCPACDGKKILPGNRVLASTAKPKEGPKTFRLKNGYTLSGKLEMTLGSRIYIRTEDGKQEEIEAADVVPDNAPTTEASKQ